MQRIELRVTWKLAWDIELHWLAREPVAETATMTYARSHAPISIVSTAARALERWCKECLRHPQHVSDHDSAW